VRRRSGRVVASRGLAPEARVERCSAWPPGGTARAKHGAGGERDGLCWARRAHGAPPALTRGSGPSRSCGHLGLAGHRRCGPWPSRPRAALGPGCLAPQPGGAGVEHGPPPHSHPRGRLSPDALAVAQPASLGQADGAHVGAGATGCGGTCSRVLHGGTQTARLCLLSG
jgi:hypothetical protein